MNQQSSYLKSNLDDLPLFHQPFWLNAVAEGKWDVAMLVENQQMVASMPYVIKNTLLGTEVIMPGLTQFLGPHFSIQSGNYREQLSVELELLEKLLKQLPSFGYLLQRWHFNYQNWLPFYWEGFQQTTRYTYILPDISDPLNIRARFNDKVNREINKAEKFFKVEKSANITLFYSLLKDNFSAKGMPIPFDEALLKRIYQACKANNAGDIWLSTDQKGIIAAGIFVAWDKHCAYYIIGGKNDSLGNSGAMSQLFWHCFNDLQNTVKQFDFEGSMIKGVENYFRSFGSIQKGYFELSKINSLAQKLKVSLRKTLKR